MALGRDYPAQDCSLARTLEIVGERWTLLVLRDCFYGIRRFSDFHAHLDIPKAILAERLKALVVHGVLCQSAEGGEQEYLLTERGLALWPAVFALAQWGEKELTPNGPRRIFTHTLCGSVITTTGWCPTCQTTPTPDGLTIEAGPGADPTLRHDRVSSILQGCPHQLLTPLTPGTPPRSA